MHKHSYLTPKQIQESCHLTNPEDPNSERVCEISEEFRQGYAILQGKEEYKKSVTFFGSARLEPKHRFYEEAYTLAKRIGEELKYAVVTGGAAGIMEAANHGAYDAHVPSIGLTITLPTEQSTNKYVTQEVPFNFFFSRKVLLAFSAEAYIFFPGGFGTMDEFFGILTLVQTRKVPPIPIILYGVEFWSPLVAFFKDRLINEYKTVSNEDLLFTMTDDMDQIIDIIKSAPIQDGE